MLDSGFCLGDPALVYNNICAPHLWTGAISSMGPGFGLVYGCSGPHLDPRRGCVQDDKSRRNLLEGGFDACVRTRLLMSSELWIHLCR